MQASELKNITIPYSVLLKPNTRMKTKELAARKVKRPA